MRLRHPSQVCCIRWGGLAFYRYSKLKDQEKGAVRLKRISWLVFFFFLRKGDEALKGRRQSQPHSPRERERHSVILSHSHSRGHEDDYDSYGSFVSLNSHCHRRCAACASVNHASAPLLCVEANRGGAGTFVVDHRSTRAAAAATALESRFVCVRASERGSVIAATKRLEPLEW